MKEAWELWETDGNHRPAKKQNIHRPARGLSKTWDQVQSMDQVQSIAVVRYGSSFVENSTGSNDRRAFSFPASFSTKTVHLENPARFGWEMERKWIDPKENNIKLPPTNLSMSDEGMPPKKKKHYEAFIHWLHPRRPKHATEPTFASMDFMFFRVSDGFLPKKIPEKHQGSELRSCRPTIAVTVPPCCLRRRSTARRPAESRDLRWLVAEMGRSWGYTSDTTKQI